MITTPGALLCHISRPGSTTLVSTKHWIVRFEKVTEANRLLESVAFKVTAAGLRRHLFVDWPQQSTCALLLIAEGGHPPFPPSPNFKPHELCHLGEVCHFSWHNTTWHKQSSHTQRMRSAVEVKVDLKCVLSFLSIFLSAASPSQNVMMLLVLKRLLLDTFTCDNDQGLRTELPKYI